MIGMPEQMQQQMKQMSENVPRFDYKVIRFFESKEEMQKAVDALYNNGFMNLNTRTLTENFIEEIYELYIFLPRELKYTLWAGIIGAAIGRLLGWLLGNNYISPPFLNPISAGGLNVATFLGMGIGAILLATIVAIVMLFKPIDRIRPGHHMLTVYADAERRKDLHDLLEPFKSVG